MSDRVHAAPPCLAINEAAAVKRVMALMSIRGRSGLERAVADRIRGELRSAGARPSQLFVDQAHRKSSYMDGGGDCGNLALRLPGTIRGPRRMLAAHMDTVPICEGSKPVRRGDRIVSADQAAALGADDRAGCAVILTAACEILRRRLSHPPLTFLWMVQEEVGPFGSRFATLGVLGGPKLSFNWDGTSPWTAVVGATGACGLEMTIRGKASHAGNSPERGVSAAAILGRAMAELVRGEWHGLVMKNGIRGTSNVGVVRGGEATNVVMDALEVQAEARAHDPGLRRRIVDAYRRIFARAANATRSSEGRRGATTCRVWNKYEAFVLADDEPCVLEAERAVRAEGFDFRRVVSNAGLDANWLTARGIPTVTLGAGMDGVHAVGESLNVDQYLAACRIALRLASGNGATFWEGSQR